MLNSTILDVAISLMFVFLLFSLLSSTVKELIAGWLNLRGEMLAKGIGCLLSRQSYTFNLPLAQQPTVDPTVSLDPAVTDIATKAVGLVDQFFKHPVISNQTTSGVLSSKQRKPSYISDTDFSISFLSTYFGSTEVGNMSPADLRKLVNGLPLPADAKKSLGDFLDETDRGLSTVRKNVEDWYNDSMDRVSGWYKRQAQFILYLLAIVLVLVFNIDTIKMATRIYHDAPLRAAIVASASQPLPQGTLKYTIKAPAQNSKSAGATVTSDSGNANSKTVFDTSVTVTSDSVLAQQYNAIASRLSGLNLPIGWGPHSFENIPWFTTPFWTKLLGLAISVFALSLGAPFWFDALNKITNIRSGGPKPTKSDDPVPASK